MQMLQLKDTPAHVTSYNSRGERHGEEVVPAADLAFKIKVHNSVLDQINPILKEVLFRKPSKGEQGELEIGDGLTKLRLPDVLMPMKLAHKFPGYTLSVGTGLGKTKPRMIHPVELSKFSIEPAEGGSVEISLKAAFEADEDTASLGLLVQQDVVISLDPPKESEA